MNYTQNYKLNQWEASDRVLRTDFNADNAKIDAAIKALEGSKGNCRIETGSYVGDGDKHRVMTIATSFPAKIVFVMSGIIGVSVRGSTVLRIISSTPRTAAATWTDEGISWRNEISSLDASDMLNSANTTYYYVVIG